MISFFFKPGEPAGMFTKTHILALLITLLLIHIILKKAKNITWEKVLRLTKVLAIFITILEGIKITYALKGGNTNLDAWFPLSFCSLFIYSLWFSGFGKGKIQKLGLSFISIGALTGGFSFLIFPTTSLMSYPITHYLCLYSIFFHSCMVILSILYLKVSPYPWSKNLKNNYYFLFTVAATISIISNTITGSNLMILREPYNIPVNIIQVINEKIPILYTIIAILVYIFIPTIVSKITEKKVRPEKV